MSGSGSGSVTAGVGDNGPVAGPSGVSTTSGESVQPTGAFYGAGAGGTKPKPRCVQGYDSESDSDCDADDEYVPLTESDDYEENVDEPSAGDSQPEEAGDGDNGDGGVAAGGEGVRGGDGADAGHHVKKTGRKRVRDPSKWSRNIAKGKRNRGVEYISDKTKRQVEKRVIGPRCPDGCFDKVGNDVVQRVFASYWDISEYNLKNAYLFSRVQTVPCKRKRTERAVSQKKTNYVYTVKDSNNVHKLCRKGFLSIHGISEKKLAYVLKIKSSPSGTPIPDKRGRRVPWNKMDESMHHRVLEHINLIPVTVSHYTRAKAPHRRYMEEATSLKKLFQKYLKWMGDTYPQERTVGEQYYCHVFTHEFNIMTKPPMKDTCSTCDEATAKIKVEEEQGNDTTALKASLQVHKDKAKDAQAYLKSMLADTSEERCVVAIDLQQTLPCPRLPAGKAYYLRKLWVYNFCIHDVKNTKSYMYVWNETEAARGSDEVASCLLHWISERQAGNAEFTILTIFADNCGGQNKNINIILMALREVHSRRLFRVELTFLVSGHSFLPCDRSFGVIEKAIRQREVIYTPADYYSVIKGCNFTVHEMKRTDFVDIKSLQKKVTIRRATQRRFSRASQIITTMNYKEGYLLKDDFSDHTTDREAFRCRLQPGQRAYNRNLFDLSADPLPAKFDEDRDLTPGKLQDLQTMNRFMDTVANKEWWQVLLQRQASIPAEQQRREEEEGTADSEDEMQDYYETTVRGSGTPESASQ